jgi:hypothetical protein
MSSFAKNRWFSAPSLEASPGGAVLLRRIGVLVLILSLFSLGVSPSEAVSSAVPIRSGAVPTPTPVRTAARCLFLHHSTGGVIWDGGVEEQLAGYAPDAAIEQRWYPSNFGNYPYDYWNIWVRHAGPDPFGGEDTLEILAGTYDLIVLKHCFPVSEIGPDEGSPDVTSESKTLGNYKAQYLALRTKLRSFPGVRFILWTGAVHLQGNIDEEQAGRTREFFDWVRDTWDEPGDNIYLWDFYFLETDGGLYLKPGYAASEGDSHPDGAFARRVAPAFARRIAAVLSGRGDVSTDLSAGVRLQGRSGDLGDAALRALVRSPEGEARFALSPDKSGAFVLSLRPGPVHQVALKESRSLTKILRVSTEQESADFGILPMGDANDDDRVGLVDFSLLAACFGRASGDASFDTRPDFNGDRKISIRDFALLAMNYGRSGDRFAAPLSSSLEGKGDTSGEASGSGSSGCSSLGWSGAVLLLFPGGFFLFRRGVRSRRS